MAVELAKVALWLHTFTVGAPLSFLDHHVRSGNSLFGFWVRTAMDRLTKWGGQLLINEPMKKAMAQAIAMQKLERVTDVDIAEVHESKTLFDGIEQETGPLNTFIKILYALDWQKLDKEDETAVRAWLDGQFGDPFDIARGKFRLGPADEGAGNPEAKDVLNRVPEKMVKSAEHFGGLLNRARALISSERFQNWQVSFPGVWKQWESAELNGGFDAVIGNPPYIRQELIKNYKPALKRAFAATYDGSADLYVYFYEQGLKLVRPGGRLSYVVTNKWLRAGYAEGVRHLFADKAWVEFVADFGHAKHFFPDADVFPSVIVVRKPNYAPAPADTQVCVISRDDVPEKGLDAAVVKATYALPRVHFTKENWTLEPPAVVTLLDKIKRAGIPLKDFAGVEPFYGIKTGLNEAFLIETATRDRLLAEDPSLSPIIKPYLRGQDIDRWSCADSGLFMIMMKSSENYHWPWSDAPDEAAAEHQFSATYPGLYRHFKKLEQFKDPKTGKLRGLRHQVIQFHSRYCLDRDGRLSNDKTFFLPTDDPWLLAVLNSSLMWWYNWRHLTRLKDEALSPMAYKITSIPIAASDRKSGRAAANYVDRLIAHTRFVSQGSSEILDWLRHEFEVAKPGRALADLGALDADTFTSAVRHVIPKKRKLTAAEIADLKREHAKTIEPLRKARMEIFARERDLSDLVNAAYRLTADEVSLMWETAPPRMRFTPAGLNIADPIDDEDENQEG